MGFKQLMDDMVSVAIDILDDLAPSITYTSIDNTGTYNPITDELENPVLVTQQVDSVLASFSLEESKADSVVVATDMKCLISSKDLGSIIPSEKDIITEDENGRVWDVIGVKSVPGESLWIIHVRRQ